MPYLDEIIGRPKREDAVRLTALRAGEVNFINHMAYASVEDFRNKYGNDYNIWPLHLGGVFVSFNWEKGPFKDKRVRQAASHAIDREALHHAVFFGQARMLTQPYPPGNPWSMDEDGYKVLEYDPDQAKSLLKQAKVDDTIHLLGWTSPSYSIQLAEVLQSMWTEVGFKVRVDPVDGPTGRDKLKKEDFHALVQGIATALIRMRSLIATSTRRAVMPSVTTAGSTSAMTS